MRALEMPIVGRAAGRMAIMILGVKMVVMPVVVVAGNAIVVAAKIDPERVACHIDAADTRACHGKAGGRIDAGLLVMIALPVVAAEHPFDPCENTHAKSSFITLTRSNCRAPMQASTAGR